jgi:hypothetical protein
MVELALRQQLATYAQKQTKPKRTPLDRAFWVALFRLWPRWKEVLVIVKPDTVVRWHRKGFRRYWRLISTRLPRQALDRGKRQRWVGSCKREVIDHVIVFDEDHLRRLLREYVSCYNAERVHIVIRDAPEGRAIEAQPSPGAKVVGLPRVGGLHHRYLWQEAA